jgi:hypothetical protein
MLLAVAFLCGCSAHKPIGINYVLGPECHISARLFGCDSSSPPRCKKIFVKYDKNCEQIAISKP